MRACDGIQHTRRVHGLAQTGILWPVGDGVDEGGRASARNMSVCTPLIQRLRQSDANIACPFFSAPDLILTFVLHRLRHGIPSTARCHQVSLCRVGGVVCVLLRRGCLPTSVCLCPPSTGNGFCDCFCCPMVFVPSNDWDP